MNERKIKNILVKALDKLNNHRYNSTYIKWLKERKLPDKPVPGEREWREKWGQLGYKPHPVYFRLFSHYIGNDVNIVPKDLCQNIIELTLNPFRYHGYYGDKNMFDKVMPEGVFPPTVLRRMYGCYYDADYKRIALDDNSLAELLKNAMGGVKKRIIVKPTLVTMGGVGVTLYENNGGVWRDVKTGERLTLDYLDRHSGEDFIMQEAFEQYEFMSQFNPTSVNTIRLAVYKSVNDDRCHVTQAIMRIGRKGSIVDNGCAGGMFVGINKSDGALMHYVSNEQGYTCTEFNGIDFKNEYKVPFWNSVVGFAETVCQYIPNQRLFALDVALRSDGKPCLLEYNLTGFSIWLFQYTAGPAFGEYTDEIIDYCKSRLGKRERVLYL